MTDIAIAAPRHSLRAYLRRPGGNGPWPGVVVLHDLAGQTRDNRGQTDWLAASGYLAVAPDLYSWGNKLFCIQAVFRDMLARKGATFEDIDAVRSALADRDDCTGKVGVIGFCMGGAFALLIATDRAFSASSVNYGMVPKDAETLLTGACPVIGSFGERDLALKGAAVRLQNALRINDVDHDVKEYPEAGHGFMNRYDGTLGWVLARIKMKYDAAAAADARSRILAFFGRHLH